MKNKDNKTTKLKEITLTSYVDLIEGNPCHIASVAPGGVANLAVASDIKVLDDKTILISNNEMEHTPDNILANASVVLTSFNEAWAGLRITGNAKYYISGKYFKICDQLFKSDKATPKGAIVIKVKKLESLA